jgi:hypothetical protein
LRLEHTHAAAAPALRGARRLALLPLMAAALLAGGCRGDGNADDEQAPPAAAPSAAPASDAGTAETQPAAAAPAAPVTVEDSIRMAREDSTALATDYHQRLGSMETYASCMQKAKAADPEQRPVLEGACKRARGAPR